MKSHKRFRTLLRAFSGFLSFFCLVAFVITCSLMLFVSTLQSTLGVTFSAEEITAAAKITAVNVVLISLGFTAVDMIRRRLAVRRPVKKITEAISRMIKGDFDVRIAPTAHYFADDGFDDIIDGVNRMAQELAGVETLRTDFIANVSHEMKTPLAVIRNYGTLLQSKELDEETRIEYARAINDASRKLSDMMTNILKLNRLENQQIYPTPKTFELGEQLCECLLQYESVWEEKGIEIETEIEEGVLVSADAELLSLVWNNLFSNAFKFTDRGGKVTVTLTSSEHHATVRVSDTGCGMSQEVGAHIFEKFYQGDSSRATQGNGLGLALVKRVADIVEGEIGVESTLGVGTTFTVRIRRA